MSYDTFGWLRDRWITQDNIDKLRKLMALSGEMGVSMASLAVAWTIANPHVTSTILGATREEQLAENLKALDVVKLLTPEVHARIEEILQNKPSFDLS
jgi:aryl-alcohol dehydrogenase-like predicted oxidoreductase